MPPDEAPLRLARAWLERAEVDLTAARLLLAEPTVLGAAVYHGQQVAEKALKGYLA
jgi:HEPN domain-containing protein